MSMQLLQKKLGELCNITIGKTPSRGRSSYWDKEKETDNVWLSIADLQNAEDNIISDSKEYISSAGAGLCKVVKEGTLLASFKLTLGRLAFAGRDLYTNEAIAALNLKNEDEVRKKYLFYFLKYFDWNKAAGDVKLKGKTLNKKKLNAIEISYPSSLLEQDRIVGILDKIFSEIDEVALNDQKNYLNAREIFESTVQYELEKGGADWKPTSLGNEVDLLSGFAFKSAQYSESESDIRLLRGDNIVQGSLRWDDAKRWSADDVEQYSRYNLQEGDVVLAMDRPWVSAGLKRAQITAEDLPCLLVQRTSRLRGTGVDNRFLLYLINSSSFIKHILGVQTGIGVPHISGQQIKDFKFLKPPVAEQEIIVQKLDEISSEASRLMKVYERKKELLDDLKQSTLHDAMNEKFK